MRRLIMLGFRMIMIALVAGFSAGVGPHGAGVSVGYSVFSCHGGGG